MVPIDVQYGFAVRLPCKNLGEVITKHRLGDGLKLCRASEAAYKIVESAIRTRTKGLHVTTH